MFPKILKAMHFLTKKLFQISLCTALAVPARAQDKLSLTECIDMALARNLKIREAELGLQSTINAHQQTKRELLPSVEGVFNPGYSLGRSVDPYTNLITNNQIGTNSLWIKADWILFNGYQRKNAQEQAAMNLSASQLDVQSSRNSIVLHVLQAYMQVLMSKELLHMALAQSESTQQQIDRTNKQIRLQVVPESALYSLQAQLANDKIQITNAGNDLRIARMNLNQLLNRPATESEFELNPVENSDTILVNGNGKDIYLASLSLLPEIKASEIRVKSAEKSLEIARGLKHPVFSLSSSFGTAFSSIARKTVISENYTETPINAFVDVDGKKYQATSFSPSVEQKTIGYFNQLGLNRAFSLNLSIRIPVFNATRSSYKMQEARIQKMIAANQQSQVRQALMQQIEQAFRMFENAAERYKTLYTQVIVLEKALHAAEIRLANGVSSPLEYTLAKSSLDRAKANLIQTKYECTVRKKVLQFYETGSAE
ncbi:TolC family protein [Dyadobacter flavalbus]|uniref:TolC family protein n=2 Tax=Dyadobacter flavalbus TaxID=2579942 RepID=A0A5M8QXI9_9BACT|nr:TolC family protein [Dyadobacter flavalbus]